MPAVDPKDRDKVRQLADFTDHLHRQALSIEAEARAVNRGQFKPTDDFFRGVESFDPSNLQATPETGSRTWNPYSSRASYDATMAYAGDKPPRGASAAPADDLLSEWGPATGKAPAAAGGASSEPPDDLLSEWMPKAQPAKPAATPPARPMSASTDHESAPDFLTRVTRENPGDTWTEGAIRTAAGAGRGLGDVGDTLAQGIAFAGEKGAEGLSKLGIISPESAKSVADWRAGVGADIARDNKLFDAASGGSALSNIGRIGGQIAGSAPFIAVGGGALGAATRGAPVVSAVASRPVLSSIIRGAGTGAAATGLTSSTSDEPLSDQLTEGGTAGAVLGPIGHGLGKLGGKLFGSGIDRETANLAAASRDKFGIPIRADQISSNPMVRFMGSVMQRLPFTGLGEHAAEQQSGFNRAIAKELGENADKITRPVLKQAAKRIGDTFDDVALRTGAIKADIPFAQDLQRIGTDAMSVLGNDVAPIESQFRRIIARIDPNTQTLSAESYQSLTRKDTPLSRAQQSKDPNVRYYANQLRNALDDMMQRSAPADAVADLKQARYQWAVLKTVEPLAKKAPTGDISPALLLGKSKGGNLEQLGQIGQRFLKEPPSSGTAERLAVMKMGAGLAAGAAGVGGAAYFDPENYQRDAAGIGAAMLAARGGGAALKSKLLSNMLIRRGQRAAGGNPLRITIGPRAGALAVRQSNKPVAPSP